MAETAVLILAGGTPSPEMQQACGGVLNRALVSLHGKPMLDYVVDAVRAGTDNARVLVAGDVPLPSGCVAVAGGDSLVDTLMNGVAGLNAHETALLVVTADLPFLTGVAVRDFVAQTQTGQAAFWYPIVPADICQARFPAMKRTTLRIAEGTFTGGNIVLLDPSFLRANEATLRAAYARRKDVLALARLIGPGFLLRLIASRAVPGLLGIGHVEAAIGRLLGGVSARAVVSQFSEIGADVDRPEDIALAEQYLARV